MLYIGNVIYMVYVMLIKKERWFFFFFYLMDFEVILKINVYFLNVNVWYYVLFLNENMIKISLYYKIKYLIK